MNKEDHTTVVGYINHLIEKRNRISGEFLLSGDGQKLLDLLIEEWNTKEQKSQEALSPAVTFRFFKATEEALPFFTLYTDDSTGKIHYGGYLWGKHPPDRPDNLFTALREIRTFTAIRSSGDTSILLQGKIIPYEDNPYFGNISVSFEWPEISEKIKWELSLISSYKLSLVKEGEHTPYTRNVE